MPQNALCANSVKSHPTSPLHSAPPADRFRAPSVSFVAAPSRRNEDPARSGRSAAPPTPRSGRLDRNIHSPSGASAPSLAIDQSDPPPSFSIWRPPNSSRRLSHGNRMDYRRVFRTAIDRRRHGLCLDTENIPMMPNGATYRLQICRVFTSGRTTAGLDHPHLAHLLFHPL